MPPRSPCPRAPDCAAALTLSTLALCSGQALRPGTKYTFRIVPVSGDKEEAPSDVLE